MKYIDATLIKGEKVVLTPRIHKIVYAKPFIFLGILSLIFLLAGFVDMNIDSWVSLAACELGVVLITAIWYLYDKLYYTRVEMAVTNKRVVAKTGIISVHSEELQWNKIEAIEIRQGILGRWLNYGDIYFSGTGTSFVRFGDVQDPWKVKSESAEILSN